MRSLETLDPTELHFGARVVLVGTTTYRHYKHGEIETEAIVVLQGSFGKGQPDWDGTVDAQVSIAWDVSHSNRGQSNFLHTSIHHPDVIKVGETLLLNGSPEHDSSLHKDTRFTIASMQVR